jgi:hypothetical protein
MPPGMVFGHSFFYPLSRHYRNPHFRSRHPQAGFPVCTQLKRRQRGTRLYGSIGIMRPFFLRKYVFLLLSKVIWKAKAAQKLKSLPLTDRMM